MNDCRIFDLLSVSTNKNFSKFFENCPQVIAVRVFEEYTVSDDVRQSFQILLDQAQKFPDKKVTLLTEEYRRKILHKVWPTGLNTVQIFSHQLLLVYKGLIIDRQSEVAKSWDPKNQNWLFLMGKLNRSHRLGLLYFLYKKNLLDLCTWSLRFNECELDQYLEFMPDLTQDQIRQWLTDHTRSPDQIDVFKQPSYREPHYGGIPYGDVYKNALFQVISETSSVGVVPHITEKFWISVLNRRPFIIFGIPGTYQALEAAGINTYREFLIDTDFDTDIPMQDRFESLAKNITHWIRTIPEQKDKISAITESNFAKAIELAEHDLDVLRDFAQQNQTDMNIFALSMTELPGLPYFIEHAKWEKFYSRVRDPSWPDCPDEEDFANLPDWIRRECIEVFGYQPKENT